jgi:hypothetical protein
MTHIHTIPPEDADAELRQIYDQDVNAQGYIANYTSAMSLRPKAITAWRALSSAVRSTMPLRQYELVTIAAAIALKGTY